MELNKIAQLLIWEKFPDGHTGEPGQLKSCLYNAIIMLLNSPEWFSLTEIDTSIPADPRFATIDKNTEIYVMAWLQHKRIFITFEEVEMAIQAIRSTDIPDFLTRKPIEFEPIPEDCEQIQQGFFTITKKKKGKK